MLATEERFGPGLAAPNLHHSVSPGPGQRIYRRHEAHERRDPATDDCLDCGATRGEMDDALAPTCEKIMGQHRAAVIALRREIRHQEAKMKDAVQIIRASEHHITSTKADLELLSQRRDELKASIAALEG